MQSHLPYIAMLAEKTQTPTLIYIVIPAKLSSPCLLPQIAYYVLGGSLSCPGSTWHVFIRWGCWEGFPCLVLPTNSFKGRWALSGRPTLGAVIPLRCENLWGSCDHRLAGFGSQLGVQALLGAKLRLLYALSEQRGILALAKSKGEPLSGESGAGAADGQRRQSQGWLGWHILTQTHPDPNVASPSPEPSRWFSAWSHLYGGAYTWGHPMGSRWMLLSGHYGLSVQRARLTLCFWYLPGYQTGNFFRKQWEGRGRGEGLWHGCIAVLLDFNCLIKVRESS